MKVLIVARTYLVKINQKKIEELALYPDTEIMVIVPQTARETIHALITAEEPIGQRFTFSACPVWHIGQGSKYIFKSLDLAMRSFKPDIIHTEEGTRSLTAFQIALYKMVWASRAKLICFTWDNIETPIFKPFYGFEKFTLSQSAAVICGNEDATKNIKQKGFKRPVYTIPQLGIDTNVFQSRDGSNLRQQLKLGIDTFVVGFGGRLVKEKGPLILLEAVSRLKGKWALVMIGAGPEQEAINRRAAELGITDRLRMVKPVKHHELAKFYSIMDVLVSSSTSTPLWKEQFGLIVAQAMSAGVAVIGSTCGETPNLIGQAGLLFPEGDWVALSAQLARLQNNKDLRYKLGQLGVQRIKEQYSWQRIAQQTHQLWSDLYHGR